MGFTDILATASRPEATWKSANGKKEKGGQYRLEFWEKEQGFNLAQGKQEFTLGEKTWFLPRTMRRPLGWLLSHETRSAPMSGLFPQNGLSGEGGVTWRQSLPQEFLPGEWHAGLLPSEERSPAAGQTAPREAQGTAPRFPGSDSRPRAGHGLRPRPPSAPPNGRAPRRKRRPLPPMRRQRRRIGRFLAGGSGPDWLAEAEAVKAAQDGVPDVPAGVPASAARDAGLHHGLCPHHRRRGERRAGEGPGRAAHKSPWVPPGAAGQGGVVTVGTRVPRG